jgi:hypothetical protein
MGVELEYFYSLHQKTISFYNFTQSSRIKSWWFETIKKQTTNKWIKKNVFIPNYQMIYLFFSLNVLFFQLKAKNEKRMLYITCFVIVSQKTNKKSFPYSSFILFLTLNTTCAYINCKCKS